MPLSRLQIMLSLSLLLFLLLHQLRSCSCSPSSCSVPFLQHLPGAQCSSWAYSSASGSWGGGWRPHLG